MKRKADSILVFHPFLIAISPALSLYIINQYKMNLSSFLWVGGLLLLLQRFDFHYLKQVHSYENIRKSATLVPYF